MMELFDDQQDVVERVRRAMRRHKSVLMQSPTGSGKTVMATFIVMSAMSKGSTVWFVVPRRELLRQTSETFDEARIRHGIISAGFTPNPFAQVQIATSQTLIRRMRDGMEAPKIVIVDECHFGGATTARVVDECKARGAWVLGLSATPLRMDGKGMGEWYDALVEGQPLRELIDAGRLSDYRIYAPTTPDLSGIKTAGGDYQQKALADRFEKDRVLIGDAVKHYRDLAMGRLCIAYCVSVEHAQRTAAMFSAAGIPADSIDGSMSDAERRGIIRRFAERKTLVLANCELLTFGFDLARAAGMDVTVEALSDLRPTKSLPLQMQKWGRALRAKDFPAIILDHGGNVAEHGLPCQDREWSLAGRDRKNAGEGVEPTKQCPDCMGVHNAAAPACPYCGHEYAPIDTRSVPEIDGELVEITDRPTRKQEQAMAQSLDELIALGRRRGYKRPEAWAAHVMTARARRRLTA